MTPAKQQRAASSGIGASGRTTFVMLGLAAAAILAFTVTAREPAMTIKTNAAWHNAQQAALSERAASEDWTAGPQGLFWRRIEGDGTGEKPTLRDTVTVHYAGTLVDGTTFDSSFDRGQPATFPLSGLIPAWQLAIPLMGVGDTIEIAAPSDIAYGPNGTGPIPGGATLLFTIELRGIR